MNGVNLGFASVSFKIPALGPSIYRGFESLILCACRTPSPSSLIGWGFGFDHFPLRFWLVMARLAWSAIRHGVRDDLVLGRSWATRERSRGRLGWAGGESFSLWPYSRVKTFSIFQFAIYFEFNSSMHLALK
jgi:hypothetical protein